MPKQEFCDLLDCDTPLVNALMQAVQQDRVSFHTPGHKKGRGSDAKLQRLLGKQVFGADLPELPELDNLFAPEGAIAQAQYLAARCFGALASWFLVNGSTCGISAAIVATCGAGEKIILPRNIHISAISGLILTGAIPVFINPKYDLLSTITYSITSEALKKTLKKDPNVKAVMALSPSYQGICPDLSAIAEITHSYEIPLLVDEAHGAHFGFHDDLPPAALKVGADLTVQSTHKVLGAMTQASMLHVQGDRIDPQRISRALQLLQSTSPSYLLLASLDAARKQMATVGRTLMNHALYLAERARKEIAKIPKLSVLEFSPQPGFAYLDPTRLTVDVSQLGITGYSADEILHDRFGVTCELPLLNHLTFIITFGNTEQDIDRLITAFKTLAQSHAVGQLPLNLNVALPPTELKLTPREAYFAETEPVTLEQANGRICGELICPYPPGIPVLMPGEAITTEAVEYLRKILDSGGVITGSKDSSLRTLEVIK